MEDLMSKRIVASDTAMLQEIGDESVILDLSSENYFSLDDVGTHMWQVLTSSDNVREACDALQHEYDVAPDILEQDLLRLCTASGAGLNPIRLNRQGLLQYCAGSAS